MPQIKLPKGLREDLIAQMAQQIVPELRMWRRTKWMTGDPKVAIYSLSIKTLAEVSCAEAVNILTSAPSIKMQRAAGRVGRKLMGIVLAKLSADPLVYEKRFDRLKKTLPAAYRLRDKKFAEIWGGTCATRVGQWMLEMIADNTGVLSIRSFHSSRRDSAILIEPGERFAAWSDKISYRYRAKGRIAGPQNEPHPEWEVGDEILPHSRNGPRNPDAPRYIAQANRLGAVPWRVNKRVQAVMATAVEAEWKLEGLPGVKPKYLFGVSRLEWLKRHHKIYEWQNLAHRAACTLGLLAEIGQDDIYYRWSMCFRGRLYTQGRAINPQGRDIERALMEFSNGVEIGDGGDELAIHGANLWGIKGTYSKRKQWVEESEEMILASAYNPFTNREWGQASDPWRFLAFCFEWQGYRKNGKSHITHLPCQIDGTCNAVQNVALLLRDRELARLVNVVATPGPEDLYQEITDEVNELMAARWTGWNSAWASVGVTRKMVKPIVISIVYGGSRGNGTKQAREVYWDLRLDTYPEFRRKITGPCIHLADTVREVTVRRLGSLLDLATWARALLSKVSKKGEEILWHTPSGMPVYGGYTGYSVTRQLRSPRDGKRSITLAVSTGRPDPRLTSRSLVPNFIQSLDAAALVASLEKFPHEVVAIHDCVGTLAPWVPALHKAVREGYKSTYEADPLGQFAVDFGKDRASIPPLGDLDLDELLTSPYFFT